MKRLFLLFCACALLSTPIFALDNSKQANRKITIRVLTTVTTQKPEGPLAEEYIAAYMAEHPDVAIEVTGVPMNQALTKITTSAAADALPDLFVNTENLRGKLYDMGITEDLRPYMSKAELDNIVDSIRASCSIDGKLIIYPWYTAPNAIIYRSDWLAAKRLPVPQTWDDILKVSRAMTEDTNKDGKIDRWGFGMVGTNDDSGQTRFVQILRSFGARELYQENGKWKTEVGSPASVKAFKYFTELQSKYDVVPPGSLSNSFNENVNLFAAGQVGLLISGPHTIGKVLDANPALKGKIGSVVIAKGETRYTPLSVLGFSLNPASKVKKEAMDFVKYLTTKERMIKWVEKTGRMPCIKDASKADYLKTPMFKGFVESVATQEMVPDAPFYAEVKNELGKAYQKIMLSSSPNVEKEVADAAKAIQAIIDRQ